MGWIKHIAVVALVALAAICTGCGEKAVDKIGFGTLENGIYRNKFFSMSVKFPSDWHALDDEARKEIMQAGKKMLAGRDKNLKAVLDAGELDSVVLFTVYRHPLGSAVSFNPSLACTAEKVGHLPGIKKGSDYLYHVKRLIEMGQMKYVFTTDIYSQKIGGIDFDVQDLEINFKTLKVQQKYYAAIMKGYALGFVMSTTAKSEEETINQILASVEFYKP